MRKSCWSVDFLCNLEQLDRWAVKIYLGKRKVNSENKYKKNGTKLANK